MTILWPDIDDLNRQQNEWTAFFGFKNSLKTGMQDKNAYAHAYSSAQLVYDGGQAYAKFFGDAREARSYITDTFKAISGTSGYSVKGVFLDGNRDEFNNLVGRQIAKYALENGLPRSALGYLVADALKQGLLISDEGRDPRNTIGILNYDEYIPSEALRGAIEKMYGIELEIRCFPGHTQIQTSLTTTTPIADLRIGDVVLAFDPRADNGRGTLVPRRVTKLFSNSTTEWVKLEWRDPVTDEPQELLSTPGHHFLDQFGNFPPIEQIIKDGMASVVLVCGSVVEVIATRIAYSQATANQFQRSVSVAMSAGNAALVQHTLDAWATYNFEVEDLHTYVAGGVRVHNVSLYVPETGLGRLADDISGQISNHIFGANTYGSAFYGAALSAVTSTAADAYNGRADFNAAHLGGRYMYEVAGGLGAMGGSLLAQDLISGLGIRGNAAAGLTQLGSGVGSVLAQNAALAGLHTIAPGSLAGLQFAENFQNVSLAGQLNGQVFGALGSYAGNELAGLLGVDPRLAPLIAGPMQAGMAQVGQNLVSGAALSTGVSGAMSGAFWNAAGSVAASFVTDAFGWDSAGADLGGSIGGTIGGWIGTAIGAPFGPLAPIIGAIGSFAGSIIGSAIGQFADEFVDLAKDVWDGAKDLVGDILDFFGFPILLDLDNNGIRITELSQSTTYVNADDDGLKYRTAWAGAGDGVLFYDVGNDNKITDNREYVFTEWDPTAADDMSALRAAFDSNGDGKLTAADIEFSKFKVMVTQADGSQIAQTLTALGITEIALKDDLTTITYADGSQITGQSQFLRSNGTTGIVANVTLAKEAFGHAVTTVAPAVPVGSDKTVTNTAYNADGSISHVSKSVTSANGLNITNSFDWNGDGVFDQIQTIATTVTAGTRTELVTNRDGGGILLNRTETITNATGASVTINRDSTGGNWFDQSETRVTNPDGSRTLIIRDLNTNGTVIRSTTTTTSANGLTETVSRDMDGNTTIDRSVTTSLVNNVDGSQNETQVLKAQNSTVLANTWTATSSNGNNVTISSDTNGDGLSDNVNISAIVKNVDGSTSSNIRNFSQNGTYVDGRWIEQSADSLASTTTVDLNSDQIWDVKTVESTVVNADTSRDTQVSTYNADNSLRSQVVTHLNADRIGKTVSVDMDGNGVVERTESVIVAANGVRTETQSSFNLVTGALISRTTTVVSANGLSKTTSYDTDGNGTADRSVSDVTVFNADGTSTQTITELSANNTVTEKSVLTTSANGLTTTLQSDLDGNSTFERQVTTVKTVFANLSSRVSETTTNANNTLRSSIVTDVSADRKTSTTTVDANGDGAVDQLVTRVEDAAGTETITTIEKAKNGATISKSEVVVSANGLSQVTQLDADGNGTYDTKSTTTTVYNINGNVTQTVHNQNANNSLISRSITTTSGNGLAVVTQVDQNGDGTYEKVVSDTRVLNADGSVTHTLAEKNASNAITNQTVTTVSANGLSSTIASDINGDGVTDFTTTDVTVIAANGSRTQTVETRNANNTLRSRDVIVTSDDGLTVTTTRDVDGDGKVDASILKQLGTDGRMLETISNFGQGWLFDDVDVTRKELISTSADGRTVIQYIRNSSETIVPYPTVDKFDERNEKRITVNADGSTTEELLKYLGAPSAYGQPVLADRKLTTISANGLTITTQIDEDANNVFESTVTDTTVLNSDGSIVQTIAARNADNTLRNQVVKTQSANQLVKSTTTDTDGNGTANQTIISTENLDGSVTTETRTFTSTGALQSRFTITTNANELGVTSSRDINGDNVVDSTRTTQKVLNTNGSSTTTYTVNNSNGTLAAKEISTVSDDGLSITSSEDRNGDGIFELVNSDTTTFDLSGTSTRTITVSNQSSILASRSVGTVSANGLSSTFTLDIDGNGTDERTVSFLKNADSSSVETSTLRGLNGVVSTITTTTLSADGQTSTMALDVNGNGVVDRTLTRSHGFGTDTETYRSFNSAGQYMQGVQVIYSDGGRSQVSTVDLNGDGIFGAELKRSRVTYHDANYSQPGWTREDSSLTYGNNTFATLYKWVDPKGFYWESQFDYGDWDDLQLEEYSFSRREIAANGTDVTTTFVYDPNTPDPVNPSQMKLISKSLSTTSADGLTTTIGSDYNGNGTNERVIVSQSGLDGSNRTTNTEYNAAGTQTSQVITTVSSDGLRSDVTFSNGKTQSKVVSSIDNDSYVWTETGASGTHISTHRVDANGVDVWTYKIGLANYSVSLDQAQKDYMLGLASRIFDTLLDRDMYTLEIETLPKYFTNGVLNSSTLIADVLASAEFTSKYGTLSNVAFTIQMYENTVGRAPTLLEINSAVTSLSNNTETRAGLAFKLSESIEHIYVGTSHAQTINSNLNLGGLTTSLSIDRFHNSVLTAEIVNLYFEATLDQNPAPSSLSAQVSNLMNGVTTKTQLATDLINSSSFTTNFGSLASLTNTDFISQIFLNTVGRVATTADINPWLSLLNANKITRGDLAMAFASSFEIYAAGDSTALNGYLQVNTTGLTIHAAKATLEFNYGISGTVTSSNTKLNIWRNSTITVTDAGNTVNIIGDENGTPAIGNAVIFTSAATAGASYVNLTAPYSTSTSGINGTYATLTGNNIVVAGNGAFVTLTANTKASFSGYSHIISMNSGVNLTSTGAGNTISYAASSAAVAINLLANTYSGGAAASNVVTGINSIIGSGLNDTLTGNANANILNGGDGNDTLNGGAGIDTLVGGTGDDIFVVDTTTDTITEGVNAGTDTVQSSVTQSALAANVENLTLTGTAAINGTGNAQDNVITGNAGTNILNGGDGNDVLNGGAGIDTLFGGAGDDLYIVDTTSDVITESAGGGDDTVQSSVAQSLLAAYVENLTLTGTTAINGAGNVLDNTITGNSANNTLSGGDGNDRLNGAAGIDTLIGGTGDDLYVVDTTTDVITELVAAGTDTIQSSVTQTVLAANVENLRLTGTAAINGTGNALNNTITGNTAANILDGGAGVDTLIGGGGNDTYNVDTTTDTITEADADIATGGSDLVVFAGTTGTYVLGANLERLTLGGTSATNGTGNALDNTIMGNIAANLLDGGAGSDTLDYTTSAQGVTVNLLSGVVSGGSAQGDTIFNFENVTGTGFNDVLTGDVSANTLSGGAGNDQLFGGDGNDVFYGGVGADSIDGGAGTLDIAYYSTSTAAVIVNLATNINSGGDAAGDSLVNVERVYGSLYNDTLTGDAQANRLYGYSGNDTIVGAQGNDILSGGVGNDTFVYAAGFGADTISDFTAGVGVLDVIKLSLGTAFDTFVEVIAASTQVGANTVITIDASNTITLTGILKTALVADDFIYV